MFDSNRCMTYGNDMQPDMDMYKNDYDKTNMMEGNMVGCSSTMPGVVCPPVYECPTENCVHRTIVHEVPHVCPVNTKIINHHVYRHTFTPCYTMSSVDTCENVYDGCCR